MTLTEQIQSIVFDSIDEINEQLPQGKQLAKSEETILIGKNGQLDSLGLVNFIVATEQRVEDTLDVSITLANEKAMSQEASPFQTVNTLMNYIIKLLEDNIDE
jgi:acyl carrier protein